MLEPLSNRPPYSVFFVQNNVYHHSETHQHHHDGEKPTITIYTARMGDDDKEWRLIEDHEHPQVLSCMPKIFVREDGANVVFLEKERKWEVLSPLHMAAIHCLYLAFYVAYNNGPFFEILFFTFFVGKCLI